MPGVLKTSLFIILSQLPVAGAGWLWWTERLPLRPAYALLAGVAYEAAFFLTAFAKKVWTDELEKDAVKVTADWVRGFARDSAPGFRRRYRKQVVQEQGIFNVRGLGLINTYTLKLEHVFVDLRVDPSSNPLRSNLDPIARKELAGNRPVWDFLRGGAGPGEASAFAVIGPPGCGKTTLLQHVAVTLASNRQRRHNVRAYTPVMLFLRDHVGKILCEKPPSLGALAQGYFGDAQLFPTLRTPQGWFERRLEAGRCMVLLDGLDEVADADERRAVSAWVDRQIASYPRCRFVLTARPQGYADAPLQRANVLEVQPFDARRVRRFVENWYLANETVASGGREDEGVRARARKDAEDLLRRLRATPSLDALTVNPLLLTMIAMVHRYQGALPGSRVELYDEICEVLLGRWRQSRGVKDALKTAQKLTVLRPLAAHMMESKVRDITADEAASVIAEPLELVGVTADDDPKRFLVELESSSGLLLEREAGQWSFAHLTFQEYLTAAHWLEEKETERDWRSLVGDSWWHETLRLYAAQGDATLLLRACLDADTVPALALAADFLEEAHRILPEVRRAAEQRLIEDLESEDPARRHVAAEVRLTRRLRNLQRIDDQREIDPDFITCAEYRLFLDNMGALGSYRQPDHWTAYSFGKGDAFKPLVGARSEDADAFCRWLTQRQGGNVYYRLPTSDEVRDYPAEASSLAAWCLDKHAVGITGRFSDLSLAGMPAEDEREIARRLKNLSNLPACPPTSITSSNAHGEAASVLKSIISSDPDEGLIFHGDENLIYSVGGPLLQVLNSAAARHFRDKDYTLNVSGIAARLYGVIVREYEQAREHADTYRRTQFGGVLDRPDRADRVAVAKFEAEERSKAHRRAHNLALMRDRAAEVHTASKTDLTLARQLAEDLAGYLSNVLGWSHRITRAVVLFCNMLMVAAAHERADRLRAQSALLADVFRYAYEDVARRGSPRRRWWRRRRDMAAEALDDTKRSLLRAFWWFKVLQGRVDGHLPAWEGIRIVREQASAGAESKGGSRGEGR